MGTDVRRQQVHEPENVTLVCPTCGHVSKPIPDVVLEKVALLCSHRDLGPTRPPALMKRL